MGRQMDKATLLTIGLLLVLGSTQSDVVSLKMRVGATGSTFLHINFYNGTFSTFYDCLSSNSWQECSAIFASNDIMTHQSYDYYVTSVEMSKSISGHGSGYFKCQHDQEASHLLCTRQPEDAALCGVGMPAHMSTFKLNDASSDSHSCVAIVWDWSDEEITFNNSRLFVGACDPLCMSDSSTGNLSDKGTTRDGDKSKTDTIIGITITIAVVLGVVVVGIVCWRRHLMPTKKDIVNVLASNAPNCFANTGASIEGDSGRVLQTDNRDSSI